MGDSDTIKIERADFMKFKERVEFALGCEGGVNGDGCGKLPEFEAAVGMLFVGHLFGYRVLEVAHSWDTRVKYARMCGYASWSECAADMPALGPYYRRHLVTRHMQGVSDWFRGLKALPERFRRKRLDIGRF